MAEGKFIAFEGLDGSGLTTQAELLTRWLREHGYEAYLTKEPTDWPTGAQIRMALAGKSELEDDTLALLFAADRIDHLHRVILPLLADGINIICDRYYLSSFAFQLSPKVPLEWLRVINSRCRRPDLMILIDVPARICVTRIARERPSIERFERESQLRQVRKNYHEIVAKLGDGGEDIRIIDGNRLIEEVFEDVVKEVKTIISIPNTRQLSLLPI